MADSTLSTGHDVGPAGAPAASGPSPGYIPAEGSTSAQDAYWKFLSNISGNPTNDFTIASRDNLAKTARSAKTQQLSVAAADAVVPIPYGLCRLGALVANVFYSNYDDKWVFWVIWCEGQVESITEVTLDDAYANAAITNYAGTPSGAVDPTLVTQFQRATPSTVFAETCPGLCYSVIVMRAKNLASVPTFNATVKGLRIYDPRDGTQVYGVPSTYKWSDNPSLILADYIESTKHGEGKKVIWSSVAQCADLNDALLAPGEKSRNCNLALDREALVSDWKETMRAAASVFLVDNQGQVKFVPDIDLPPVANYSHGSDNIIDISNCGINNPEQLPTALVIAYTDKSSKPWKDATTDPIMRPGTESGLIPYRLSTVDMRWITRASQANREAIERMNKLWLRSITFQLHVFDEGLSQEPGDLITVTHPEYLFNALPVRVMDVQPTAAGWLLSVEKHDVGCYSSTIQTAPTTPNTTLPLPNDPPAMSLISLFEDIFQAQTGRWASRILVRWPTVVWPFIANYQVIITQPLDVQEPVKESVLVSRDETSHLSKVLEEDLQYIVTVAIVSTTNDIGTASSGYITTNGKTALPSDVPYFAAYEVGGTIHATWQPATDRDLTGYEIRYGIPGVAWANAMLLDRVAAPGLTYSTNRLLPGTYDLLIKALDSVRNDAYPFGQESQIALRATVTVTSDAEAFIAAQQTFTSASVLKNMVLSDGRYSTGFGTTWNTLFPNLMNTYTEVIVTYHPATESGLWTNIVDIGTVVAGSFTASATYGLID